VLKLIRAFLNAGVMENGLVSPVEEGTPQGGPLSPLLSNLVLDDLDKELERRADTVGGSSLTPTAVTLAV
jgi:RNA-directed DNA polymerase